MLAGGPLAREAVKRIDEPFVIERTTNGTAITQRLAARTSLSAPLVKALFEWMSEERANLSRHAAVAGAMD